MLTYHILSRIAILLDMDQILFGVLGQPPQKLLVPWNARYYLEEVVL
jgi:hypothetical protein